MNKPVTPALFKEKMQRINEQSKADQELAHARADDLMVKVLQECGYHEGCEVFEEMDKWYA